MKWRRSLILNCPIDNYNTSSVGKVTTLANELWNQSNVVEKVKDFH
jgi:hypothetical protein